MRLDKFTQSFQEAISDAQSLALGRDHQFIEPSHLMLALLSVQHFQQTIRHEPEPMRHNFQYQI
ncbi:MAG: hypothetical protein COB41_08735 [Proteobacteria bacterium]|nr:MAG: hypothetical protein COB41_08735 [Pseudomonadota bacterium]